MNGASQASIINAPDVHRRGLLRAAATSALAAGAAIGAAAAGAAIAALPDADAAPAAQVAPRAGGDADAELIELCDQLLALNAKTRALVATRHSLEDEQRTDPELYALSDREQELTARLCQIEIRTFAEAKAVAAVIFANTALDGDGMIRTNAWGEWLPAHLTECLSGKPWGRAAA